MKKIDKGLRCTNYIIDYCAIVVIWMLFSLIFNTSTIEMVVFYAIFFLYYLTLELFFSQTLGKLVTKTHVVGKNHRKVTFVMILKRSFLRLIPIDPISYLFGTEKGLHDVLSSTSLQIKTPELHDAE